TATASGSTGVGMSGELTYATDLFDEQTVRGFATQFVRVLAAVVADASMPVGDVELLDSGEQRTILDEWSGLGLDSGSDPRHTLADRFAEQAARTPDAVAVVFGADQLTYRELAGRANRLARRLIELGVGPESLVGVALPRSADLVVALLAVIEAGAGYVPLDPSYPQERIDYVLADSRPACVLSWRGREQDFGDTEVLELDALSLDRYSDAPIGVAERTAVLLPDHVAYVIYTSGSTGRPKGVAVAHRNVVELLAGTEPVFGFGPDDVWTMFHSYAFDFSVWELWGPLLYGGRLVVVDYYTSRSPAQFLELLAREQVTVLNQTPSAFYQLVEADRAEHAQRELALRYVVFGGEALEPRRLRGWFGQRGDLACELVNMYGITETTVHVTHRRIGPADTAAASVVGRPIAGLRVYVLDDRLRPVPPNVPGEMYVAGGQLSRGYLGRPELTSVRFVADPFGSGARLYRSGDVARWTREGELEYLGRADDQVKIRGFRIELGEIEAAVSGLDGVGECAVVVREDVPGDRRLVAYVVPADAAAPDSERLREQVAAALPAHMVPAAFVVLESIPLTVNGKLDRKALPAPVAQQREIRPPVTPVEQAVAAAFAEVVGVSRVGVDDDFFALGGNSLMATRAVAQVGTALDTEVPVRLLFEASTVAALAAALESHVGAGRQELVAHKRPERIPLSLAQTRMWFLNRFESQSAAYNIPIALRLSGELDLAALQAAVTDVIARHESLRTVYPEADDGPFQRILPPAEVEIDLAPEAIGAAELPAVLRELSAVEFDVTARAPFVARLFEFEANEYVLAIVVHHISADGASMAPFARDFVTAYTARAGGNEPAWAELPVQYADYALWQRAVLGAEDDPESVAAQQTAYWVENLRGAPEQLDLPFDRPRPAVQSYR
ncbi:MAG: amino acid adenylation domain-containing protein, partial [Aldersonia sp.]|nr:amino acid adenylation domain-containing protein [Aldersonia sp.]